MPGDALHSSGTSLAAHARDVAAGRRYEFGKNWQRCVRSLTARQIAEAQLSLTSMLDTLDFDTRSVTCGGKSSCNQFVFGKSA